MSRKMTEYAAADCGEGSTENGLRYTALCSPKFRSCLLTFYFYVHRTPETAPVHALLTDLLTASSAAGIALCSGFFREAFALRRRCRAGLYGIMA